MRDFRHSGRLLGLASALSIGITAFAGTLRAQDTELSPVERSGEEASLIDKIEALESRIQALEDEKVKPFKAPFIVVDSGNREIVRIDAGVFRLSGNSGAAEISANEDAHLRLTAGAAVTTLSSGGSGAALDVADGKSRITLDTTSGPRIEFLEGGQSSFFAGSKDGGDVLFVGKVGRATELWAVPAKTGLIATVGAEGSQVGSFGNNRGFVAFDGTQPKASLAAGPNGKFGMAIFGDGNTPVVRAGITPSGPIVSVATAGGQTIAQLQGDKGGVAGQLKLFESGKEIATVGRLEDSSSGLEVKADSDRVFVGKATTGPEMSITQASQQTYSVKPGDGDGIELTIGKEKRSIKLVASSAHMNVLTTAGEDITSLGTGSKTTGLVVISGNRPRAVLGADLSDRKYFMGIYGAGDKPVVNAGFGESGRPALKIMTSDGSNEVATLEASSGNDGQLNLFNQGKKTAELSSSEGGAGEGTLSLFAQTKRTIVLGTAADKPRTALNIYNNGERVFFAGVGKDGQGLGGVVRGDQLVSGFGGDAAGNGNVFVNASGKTVATINAMDDPGRGIVAIYNGDKSVARLGMGTSGGGNVTTTDPSGMGVFSAGFVGGDGPGAACVLQKGMKCLGVGLTGMEGFH